mgnify:CR=1 FL=1
MSSISPLAPDTPGTQFPGLTYLLHFFAPSCESIADLFTLAARYVQVGEPLCSLSLACLTETLVASTEDFDSSFQVLDQVESILLTNSQQLTEQDRQVCNLHLSLSCRVP